MIESLEIRRLEHIVDDATDLSNVPFTLLSVLNEAANKFEFKVLGGLTNPLLQSALRVGQEATGLDFLGFSHPANINSFIRGIMQNKKFAVADFYTAAENILARPAIDAIQLILRIETLAVFPIIIKDQVKGLFGFISQRKLTDHDLRLMQIFVKESSLLIENILLNANLEKQVKTRTAELLTLINALPEAVATTDLNGVINFVSESDVELLGYHSSKDIIGKNAFELIAPEQKEKALNNMKAISDTKQAIREKYDLIKADGSRLPAELTAAPILDQAGQISGL